MHQQPNQQSQPGQHQHQHEHQQQEHFVQQQQHHYHQQQHQQPMLLQQIPQQQWQMSQSQYEQQMQQMQQQQQQQQQTSSPLIRKRGLVNESDEFMGIKKRNLGSEATAQGMFGYPEIGADSPGSIMSNHSNGEAQNYFDQPHYQTSSSSTNAQGRTSAPSTPAINVTQPTGSSQIQHAWASFGQGSHSSPPTPQGSFTHANSNMFSSSLEAEQQGSIEHRMQQEKQRLQEAQQQEQQRLQETQQMEIQAMQRQQEEHAKAHATVVHHDHNDPATWGYANNASQFTGYLGGYGRGYTGGVAALAAASAMAANRQRTTSSGSGMDMDM
ncbi:hypothetical protein CPC16_007931 [Podila verticillata]|nr:hypothetical protein CPC16_007931 [Podila verticillata]